MKPIRGNYRRLRDVLQQIPDGYHQNVLPLSLEMNLWSEEDLRRAALKTKIADRTLEACRDVLVRGISPTDAAAKHQIFISAISRATGTLREKHDKMIESAATLAQSREVMKLTAIQVAQNIVGHHFTVKDAEAGKTYLGRIIVNTQGYVVQKVGRTGVIYDQGWFKVLPPLGQMLQISTAVRLRPIDVKGLTESSEADALVLQIDFVEVTLAKQRAALGR